MVLLDELTALGIETWLLVGDKKTDHPRVMPLFLSPMFDYRPYDKVCDAAWIDGSDWRISTTPMRTGSSN